MSNNKVRNSKFIIISDLILFILFICSICYCFHFLYVGNEKFCLGVENNGLVAKNSLKKNIYKKYIDENLVSLSILGKKTDGKKWNDPYIGTIPFGKYMSTYEGERYETYIHHYEKEKEIHHRFKYKEIETYWGDIRSVIDGTEAYWTGSYIYTPIYHEYYWYWALSTYDINETISLLSNEDDFYVEYLDNIRKHLSDFYNIKSHYTKINGHRALAYYTYSDCELKRLIFCANKRAYLVEIKSPLYIDKCSGKYCSKIYTLDYNKVLKMPKYFLLLSLFTIILSILFLFLLNVDLKCKTRNKVSKNFFYYVLLCTIVNLLIIIICIYNWYCGIRSVKDTEFWFLSYFVSIIFINVPLIIWFYRKSKFDYKYDFLVPGFIKTLVYDKLGDEREKKIFLIFVAYPVCILLPLPLGFLMIGYLFISCFVVLIYLYLNKLNNWVMGNNIKEICTLKDYYAILGIKNDADDDDIEMSFMKNISELSMKVKYTKGDKLRIVNCHEAYAILSNDRYRMMYDAELNDFRNSHKLLLEYEFKNLELQRIICDIRLALVKRLKISDNKLIKVLIVLLILFSFLFLYKCEDFNKQSEDIFLDGNTYLPSYNF